MLASGTGGGCYELKQLLERVDKTLFSVRSSVILYDDDLEDIGEWAKALSQYLGEDDLASLADHLKKYKVIIDMDNQDKELELTEKITLDLDSLREETWRLYLKTKNEEVTTIAEKLRGDFGIQGIQALRKLVSQYGNKTKEMKEMFLDYAKPVMDTYTGLEGSKEYNRVWKLFEQDFSDVKRSLESITILAPVIEELTEYKELRPLFEKIPHYPSKFQFKVRTLGKLLDSSADFAKTFDLMLDMASLLLPAKEQEERFRILEEGLEVALKSISGITKELEKHGIPSPAESYREGPTAVSTLDIKGIRELMTNANTAITRGFPAGSTSIALGLIKSKLKNYSPKDPAVEDRVHNKVLSHSFKIEEVFEDIDKNTPLDEGTVSVINTYFYDLEEFLKKHEEKKTVVR